MDKGLAKYIDRILFTQEQIQDRIEALGHQITEDYKDQNADLLLVGILKGAVIFMAALMNEIDLDVEIDFMAVSSYGANTVSSGDIRILKDLDQKIMGKDILVIEDIIDSGYTMDYLKKNLLSRDANSVKVAVLLDKPANRAVEIPVDYVGFESPDAYVVGYGMDFNQKLRNLPFIGTLNPIYYKKN